MKLWAAHVFGVLTCILLFGIGGQAQNNTVSGRISNASSREYIPFVHIQIKSKRTTGSVSNIEGYYNLDIPAGSAQTDTVNFSCIGYKPYKTTISELKAQSNIALEPSAERLNEVIITAGEDPAYAIMRAVVANRENNNPEELPHFKFRAYNKANIDVDRTDSIQADLALTGFNQAHFMMLESATEVVYKKPGKWNEKVVASKMSGIKNPAISLVSNSFQPFACYSNYLNISGFDYLNPISPNSDSRYIFSLRDSAMIQGEEVYFIRFTPRKNAAEELMQGTLTISKSNYSLVNFLGQNTGDHALLYFEIRQAYKRVGQLWFPSESNTTYSLPDEDTGVTIIASSTTFLEDVNLDYIPKKGDFGIADIQIKTNSAKADSLFNLYRTNPLSLEERNTYAVYDTLPKNIINGMNWFMNQSESLAQGRLNFGKVDVLLNHLAAFNQYEGFRLGAGLATSRKLVKWMSAEGYVAYGFKDKQTKYGGGLRFYIAPRRELELGLFYKNDVSEPGRIRFSRDIGYLQSGETIRNLFTSRMNPIEQYEAALTYRPARGVRIRAHLIREDLSFPIQDYFLDDFSETENIVASKIGLELRYAPGESLIQTGTGFTPIKQSFPRIRILVNHAIDGMLEANTSFTQSAIEVEHELKIRGTGVTRLFGSAGKTWGSGIAYPYLSFGKGGEGESDFGILSMGYFQTMGLYDFLSDEYVQAGMIHNFGSIFGIKKSFSKPELKVSYMAAIGNIKDSNSELVPFQFRKMDKPYLEGGILIDNIFRMSSTFYYSGFGIGAFYNHGAYADTKFEENLSFILSFAISL